VLREGSYDATLCRYPLRARLGQASPRFEQGTFRFFPSPFLSSSLLSIPSVARAHPQSHLRCFSHPLSSVPKTPSPSFDESAPTSKTSRTRKPSLEPRYLLPHDPSSEPTPFQLQSHRQTDLPSSQVFPVPSRSPVQLANQLSSAVDSLRKRRGGQRSSSTRSRCRYQCQRRRFRISREIFLSGSTDS